jgi:hypothetical protein
MAPWRRTRPWRRIGTLPTRWATPRAAGSSDQPRMSLRNLDAVGVRTDDSLIDVGGGASHLVDMPLHCGFTDVSSLTSPPSAWPPPSSDSGRAPFASAGW